MITVRCKICEVRYAAGTDHKCRGQTTPEKSARADVQIGHAKFDKVSYQREYMRRWRAKRKQEKILIQNSGE